MKIFAFAQRNWKEMVRDPLTVGFGAAFPVVLLLFMTLIQRNAPVEVFAMDRLVPGIAAFGQSFLALFSALLISRDRTSALMQRLLTAPMQSSDFLLGYMLPLLPMALLQGVLCLLAGVALGWDVGLRGVAMLVALLPGAIINIALGLLFGSILNERQVGGICGAVLTNLGAWLSGAWFDIDLVGGAFETIARLLPFAANVDIARAAVMGGNGIVRPLIILLAYMILLGGLAVVVFGRRMRSDAV